MSSTRLRACVNLCISNVYTLVQWRLRTPPHVVERRTLVVSVEKLFSTWALCIRARTPDSAGNLCFTYVNALPRPTCVSRYLSNPAGNSSLVKGAPVRLGCISPILLSFLSNAGAFCYAKSVSNVVAVLDISRLQMIMLLRTSNTCANSHFCKWRFLRAILAL